MLPGLMTKYKSFQMWSRKNNDMLFFFFGFALIVNFNYVYNCNVYNDPLVSEALSIVERRADYLLIKSGLEIL